MPLSRPVARPANPPAGAVAADFALADAVAALCRAVGRVQTAGFRATPPGGARRKADGSWYSDLDRASELRLREGLARLLRAAGWLGEETGAQGRDDLLWVVDPLDGSTNYLSGLATWAISVALVRAGVAELGVVYVPPTGACFTAVRGGGARRNGRPLAPLRARPLADAVLCVCLPTPAGRPDDQARVLARLGALWAAARDLRSLGCAALECCLVAAGDVQGFWEPGLAPWDLAAASVVLTETGCGLADGDGADYRPLASRGLLAGHPGVFDALRALIAERRAEEQADGPSLPPAGAPRAAGALGSGGGVP